MARVLCLGMAVWDRILSVPDIPSSAIKLYATELAETGGGPAATAACAIARLGGEAALVARTGEDAVGAQIAAELRDFGVDTRWLRALPGGAARSATSCVAVDPRGERLILAFPGRGLMVDPAWVDWDAALAGAGCLLVDMGWPRAAAIALREAEARGIPSVLDADLNPNPEAAALIPLADHVVLSEPGLAMLAEEGDQTTALAKLAARRGGHRGSLGVTLGAQGYRWMDAEGDWLSPGFEVPVVDTLGAGDVFHGAFALALAEGQVVAGAARFANAAAAVKCTRPGGRRGIPERGEVQALLGGERVVAATCA